ncbi:MAG: aminoglycoside N(3)-acetyltransferase [Candidatus Dormibacterales bacterium]
MTPQRIAKLVDDLRALGVAEGNVVMVHASLRAVGAVEGRASGVVAALDEAVGRDGTLLMTLGAEDEWSWVNERPEAERAALLAGASPFDHLLTPADPDVGVLAEVFRTAAGTIVSDHPEGRFGARGRLAQDLLVGAPWNDYYGPGSPLERLALYRGKVLRLGADPATTTLLHYAEYLCSVPNKRRAHRLRLVRGAEGPELRSVDCLDDSDGIVEHEGEDYFATILKAYLRMGRARTGIVGQASSELIDATDLLDFAVAWMNENLAESGGRS